MTARAREIAAEQFAALLGEAEAALWGCSTSEHPMLAVAPTVSVFRTNNLTAAELRSVALAAQTLANAAFEAAIGDLADTLMTERRRRWAE